MSAPRTNIEKQKRHHLVPIVTIIAILIFVGLGFVWWLSDETTDPIMPGEVAGPVDDLPQPPPTPSATPSQ
ncbi:hypothetical protein FNJ84_20505 [Paracoccus sp. M683]|uniref:hypothetical protein n=1 Tax=Paracoccus sp. M683 TaxID=2594268 RepID=UPI00117F9271|nr:hypothetical protein [Paracoccus sp. M683]TRW93064.1 hypothetical protein FNJ84_20505 [Paracoccus sp. M683]